MEGQKGTITGVVVVGEILRVSVEGREVGRGGTVSGMKERGDIVNGIVSAVDTETETETEVVIEEGIVERIVDMGRVIVNVG